MSSKVIPRVAQMKRAAGQKIMQARIKATGMAQKAQETYGEKITYFFLFILLIALPVFSAYIAMESIRFAKKPVDATTDAKIREIHDRHLYGIVFAFALYSLLLYVSYNIEMIKKNKYFKPLFIFINFGIAFCMMVMGVDALMKIKNAGKNEEYKDYVKMLNAVVGASVIIMLLMAMWAFVGPSAKVVPVGTAVPGA